MAVHNGEATIGQAIESVLSQGFEQVELIVVNDGSTDRTEEIVHTFDQSRLKIISTSNKGASQARNTGAEMAKGTYLIFLDADDYLSGDYLERCYQVLKKGNIKLALTDAVFKTNKQTIRITATISNNRYSHFVCGSFIILKSFFTETLKGYDSRLTYSENTDIYLRIISDAGLQVEEVTTIRQAFVTVVQHDPRSRRTMYARKKYESVRYLMEKHNKFFEGSPKDKDTFTRILAFGAMDNGDYYFARRKMMELLQRNPFNARDYIRLAFFYCPPLYRWYYLV